jgi:hypothetical protein
MAVAMMVVLAMVVVAVVAISLNYLCKNLSVQSIIAIFIP